MMDKTGADGIMLARGALADPFLCAKIIGKKPIQTLKDYIIEHLTLMESRLGSIKGAVEFRKFTPYYFKGMAGVKEIKNAINTSQSTQEIIGYIREIL
jgi:tRNA-dihydrouridine synthase